MQMMAKAKEKRCKSGEVTKEPPARFTARQGQYLAYLYWYRKLHRVSPSKTEMAEYFRVSPPSVHQMVVKLEEKGLIIRERGVPRSIQVAIRKNEIPELEDDECEATVLVDRENAVAAERTRLYTLQVFLVGGPVPEKFARKEISRTIQIRGNQTLEDLHRVIFEAYNRFDEHFYEFQFGKGPHDPKGRRYVLPEMLEQEHGDRTIAGDLTRMTIDSLGLEVNQPFGYWFDYGDDWWHQIDVQTIDEKAPKGKYPKVIKRVGESPPQYMDEEDE